MNQLDARKNCKDNYIKNRELFIHIIKCTYYCYSSLLVICI